ncbi:MAG: ABC transporter substrate-binding protein [Aggregatilineales bacterium]
MRKLLLAVAVLCLLALPAVAQDESFPDWMEMSECGDMDMSGESMTLWHIGDLSGPYAPITQPLLAGFNDAVAYYNARGGICGADIALPDATTIDTGGDQELAQTIYDRVSSEDPSFLVLYSSDDSELLRDRLAEDETMVMISAGSIEGLYGGEDDGFNAPGWSFATNPLYVDQIGSFCEYAAENMEDPVIGYISWPNAFGRAAHTPESVAYCESVGAPLLETPEYFAPGSDIQGQIQNLVDAGATILYTNSLGTGPAEVAATVTNMGLGDQVSLAGVNWALDTSVGFLGQTTLGSDNLPAVNGLIGSMPFRWWTEVDQPGIALLTEQADANERGPLVRNISYILGWMTVDIFREATVRTAMANDGVVDGAGMKATMETMVYSPLGLIDVDFEDGAIRDISMNRIAELRYLGENGGPAELPDNPPMVVEGPNGPVLVPIVVPLTDFIETPDLRPGMMDMMEDE